MKKRSKSVLSVLLAASLLVGCIFPVYGADGELAQNPEAEGKLPDPGTVITVEVPGQTVTGIGPDDPDEMFREYVERIFYPEKAAGDDKSASVKASGPAKASHAGLITLEPVEENIYQILSAYATEIALGNRDYSIFTVTAAELGIEKTEWTAEELGVAAIVEDNKITEEAMNAVNEIMPYNLTRIMNVLIATHPYELYWFDKTEGVRTNSLISASTSGGEWVLDISGGIEFMMTIASDYAVEGELYVYDGWKVIAAQDAADHARDIVTIYADMPDHDKLREYFNQICQKTSYNYDAAEADHYDGTNPWQLVWVFDDNPDTKVVCEGYAKAFQYLCDLTEFNSPLVSCISVTGTMDGGTGAGAHMWNVVRMPDGGNYLVDVTNCDEGTTGEPDQLFLKGNNPYVEEGSVDDGYIFITDGGVVTYQYDQSTFDLYDRSALALHDGESYDPDAPVENCSTGHHIWSSSYTVDTEATCTQEGVKSIHCEICGMVQEGTEEAIPANGHSFGKWTVTTPPTCGEDGVQERICSVCEKKETKSIPATGIHTWNDFYTVDREATEEAEGQESIHCSVCNAVREGSERPIPIIGTVYDISAEAVISIDEQTYTGEPLTPDVTVTFNDAELFRNTDFTVTYQDNTDAGTARAVITGIGNYAGTAEKEFKINAKPLTAADVAVITDVTYTGQAFEPKPVVTLDGKTLVWDQDYTLDYEYNINVSESEAKRATVAVKGKGNYKGTAVMRFWINPASLANAEVTGITDKTYTGQALTQKVTVKNGTTVLKSGTDYTVGYSNNTEVGTATVKITGKGNYTGSVSKTFKIKKAAEDPDNPSDNTSEDKKAADTAASSITALKAVDAITLADKSAVTAARAAYNKLTAAQKKLIPADTLKKLTDAEAKIAALEKAKKDPENASADKKAADKAASSITALKAVDAITLADKSAVTAARAAYNKLTAAQKKLMPADTLKKLTDAEAKIAALEKAAEEASKAVVKGKTYTVKALKYKVTNADMKGSGTVSLTGTTKNKTTLTKLTVPKTVKINGAVFKVTAIGSKAFNKFTKIKSVTVGDNVKTIGTSAFAGNKKLTKVTIGKGVTKIGKSAFFGDKKLKTITVKSKKLKSVGKNAIKGIYKKAVIKVPKKQLKKYKKRFSSKTGFKKTMKVKK